MAEQHRYTVTYISDDGVSYNVVLGQHKIDLGGFATATPGAPRLPTGTKMRQIHGVTSNAQRSYSFPWSDPDDAAWQSISGQSFVYDGETFQITGATGERRTLGAPAL